jgi:hypothetical protein
MVFGLKGRFCQPRPKAWEKGPPPPVFGLKGRFGQACGRTALSGPAIAAVVFPYEVRKRRKKRQ